MRDSPGYRPADRFGAAPAALRGSLRSGAGSCGTWRSGQEILNPLPTCFSAGLSRRVSRSAEQGSGRQHEELSPSRAFSDRPSSSSSWSPSTAKMLQKAFASRNSICAAKFPCARPAGPCTAPAGSPDRPLGEAPGRAKKETLGCRGSKVSL